MPSIGGGKKDKSPAPPARGASSPVPSPTPPPPQQEHQPTTAAEEGGSNVRDIEDLATTTAVGFGGVEVTQRCCGAMTCRVLAPG
jgi:hypothetical protein